MLTKDFNSLSFRERNKQVFAEGKLVAIYEDNKFQKVFFYKLDDLKIDVIYDKVHNMLLDIIAWENENDRVNFLKMPVEDSYAGRVGG
jgi:hypothetical protein